MVHMSTAKTTNEARLRRLIKQSGLTQEAALELFNTAHPELFQHYSISAWKAFLSQPDTVRFRPFSDKLMSRAKTVFGKYIAKKKIENTEE
jgi:hypothetical protein